MRLDMLCARWKWRAVSAWGVIVLYGSDAFARRTALVGGGQWAAGLLQTYCLFARGQWVVELLLCTATPPGGSGRCNPCNTLPHYLGAVGSGTPAIYCLTAGGSGQWKACYALPHCLGAVGSGAPALHRHTAWRQWAVQSLQYTTTLPGGSGQWNSCNILPHCRG